jgi:hypothetical protein
MEIKATYIGLSIAVLCFVLISGIYMGFVNGYADAGVSMPTLDINSKAFNQSANLIGVSTQLQQNVGANWTSQPSGWDYINLLFMGGWSAIKMVTTSLFSILPNMLWEVTRILGIPAFVTQTFIAMAVLSLLIALIIIILNRDIK